MVASSLEDDYPLIMKFILAQLVVEQGTDSFRQIAEDLEKHPMLQDIPARKMKATRCRSLYLQMLESEGLELPSRPNSTDPSDKSDSGVPKKRKGVTPELRLAQVLYMAYSEELLQEIQNDELEFLTTYRELNDLQKQLQELEGSGKVIH